MAERPIDFAALTGAEIRLVIAKTRASLAQAGLNLQFDATPILQPRTLQPQTLAACLMCGKCVRVVRIVNSTVVEIVRHSSALPFMPPHFCPSNSAGRTIIKNDDTDHKGETMNNETAELRRVLQEARNKRELEDKIERAGSIVEILDARPAGTVIMFGKEYTKPSTIGQTVYTYAAIKPLNDGLWFVTGSETGPLSADDLAAFMLAGKAIETFVEMVSNGNPWAV